MAKKKIYILKAGAGTVSTLGANTQQNFTGDGSTVAFTLSAAPSNSIANVTINGLVQTKTTDYSISTTTLTFVTAPANADKIQVFYSAPAVGAGDALTTNPLSQFAATTSAQLRGVLSDETGTGAAVFATSPTLVTPALGTPSAVVLTNATAVPAGQIVGVIPIANLATGTPTGSKFIRDDGTLQAIAGGGDALTSNPLSQFAATTSAQLRGVLSDETGTGAAVFATSPTLVTPALGTPSAVVLTNATAVPAGQVVGVIPIANLATGTPDGSKFIRDDGSLQAISGGGDALVANPLSQFAATTSLQLKGVISDETGSGALVFATSPTLVTPILGTPTSGTLTNCTIPVGGITGLGTGVATALAINVGSAGAPVVLNGALGTPSSGTLTSCTADGTNLLGYRGAPQNSQSAAYTTVLGDAGKSIFHPVGDNNARTFTIDSNANVAYVIGTIIEFLNMAAASVTIAITSDTMTLLPAGTTGSRTLAQYGRASAEKITSTSWIISGNSALT